MLSSLFRLLFVFFYIFIWIRRLFWLVTLPVRMVREMVSDFRKFFRFIFRLFTPSFWLSLYSSVLEEGLVSLGVKIACAVATLLVVGIGAVIVIVAIRQTGAIPRGKEVLTASPTPPGEIKKGNGGKPEVRRAIAVASTVDPNAANAFYVVAGVAKGDFLNIHVRASATSPVVARMPNGYEGVQVVGQPVMNDTTEWVQVRFGDHVGWVSRAYLKPK